MNDLCVDFEKHLAFLAARMRREDEVIALKSANLVTAHVRRIHEVRQDKTRQQDKTKLSYGCVLLRGGRVSRRTKFDVQLSLISFIDFIHPTQGMKRHNEKIPLNERISSIVELPPHSQTKTKEQDYSAGLNNNAATNIYVVGPSSDVNGKDLLHNQPPLPNPPLLDNPSIFNRNIAPNSISAQNTIPAQNSIPAQNTIDAAHGEMRNGDSRNEFDFLSSNTSPITIGPSVISVPRLPSVSKNNDFQKLVMDQNKIPLAPGLQLQQHLPPHVEHQVRFVLAASYCLS